jgi:LysM repeat protein
VAVLVGSLVAANVLTARAGGRQPEQRSGGRVYVVKSGDTVWSIARGQASPSADLRPLVASLIQLNRLRGATITPGQQLVLPS